MGNEESVVVEQAFAKEIGISIYTAMKILNDAGITTEEISEITNICKNALADEIEKRNIPYEFRFLLLSLTLSRLLKTSISFHKEYMKSVEKKLKLSLDISNDKDDKFSDIEIAKNP